MANFAKQFYATVFSIMLLPVITHADQVLTIDRSVQIALERDALISAYQSRRDAYQEQSVAADSLPDPKIKLGLMNVPTDTFKRNQEAMTQAQLGIQQMFPRGSSLKIKSQRAVNMSLVEAARLEEQRRKVMRDVREAWLELYYWLNAEIVVQKNRKFFQKLVSVTRQQYAAGRQKQQDVIRSELELGMLDDKEINIRTMLEMTRTRLEKYVGNRADKININNVLPEFSYIPIQKFSTEAHPMVTMQSAMVKVGEKNVELARQSYKPSWMLDVTYGQREDAPNGTKRADFISAMVVFDLPLFTSDFQDRKVSASKHQLNSALNSKEEAKRDLKRMWDSALLKEVRLAQRVKTYMQTLVPKARENAKASLFSYQSGRGDFSALMRAQIIELETQLQSLRLNVDHKIAQAQLLYFIGENNEMLSLHAGE